jgi:hypothetical protein
MSWLVNCGSKSMFDIVYVVVLCLVVASMHESKINTCHPPHVGHMWSHVGGPPWDLAHGPGNHEAHGPKCVVAQAGHGV